MTNLWEPDIILIYKRTRRVEQTYKKWCTFQTEGEIKKIMINYQCPWEILAMASSSSTPDFMVTLTILRESSSLKQAHQTVPKDMVLQATLMQMFENISQE